jgi:ferric-dicitrate binding protein FerR (iron transport regulator)
MQKETFYALIDRYLAGTATPAERTLVETYYHQLTAGRTTLTPEEEERLRQSVLQRILQEAGIPGTGARRIPLYRRLMRPVAAAVLMLLLTGGAWLFFHHQTQQGPAIGGKVPALPVKDIAPGKQGAILTLHDGRQIVLDSLGDGLLSAEPNVQVSKKDGQLIYQHAETTYFNTLSTPSGRQFSLTLPDKSKVWLNAASSITYPTTFTGDQRTVSITGEVYLEVEPDKHKPFLVQTTNQQILVLGTHFNVNTYLDEPGDRTTLLEGAVKVSGAGNSVALHPGQQAIFIKNTSELQVSKTDTSAAVAWKNGVFHFENADLPTVMRQLARWYDVKVKFESAVPKGTFEGEIGRTLTLSQVLDALAQTRVHYRIDNKTILIMP